MRCRRISRDNGLGLIELIVAVVVSGIVLASIAIIFARSWQTQEEVLSVTQATDRGQLLGSMIERAVRNALAVRVYEEAGAQVLEVESYLAGETLCQGFSVDSEVAITSSPGMLESSGSWNRWQPVITLEEGSGFSYIDGVVSYALVMKTESAPVHIVGDVATRSDQLTGGLSCWSSS
jgi:prepilin-type N-terminal cleavage/methylation domain-containing protein